MPVSSADTPADLRKSVPDPVFQVRTGDFALSHPAPDRDRVYEVQQCLIRKPAVSVKGDVPHKKMRRRSAEKSSKSSDPEAPAASGDHPEGKSVFLCDPQANPGLSAIDFKCLKS